MEKGRNNAILLTIIGIATLLVAIVGATFAYFSAIVTGSETASTIVVQSADGGTSTFTGGDRVTVNNIYPKGTTGTAEDAWVTKIVTFHHQNESAVGSFTYSLTLNYDNTFATGELTYTFEDINGYCSDYSTVVQGSCSGTWTSATAQTGFTDITNGSFSYGNNQTASLGSVTITQAALQAGVTHAFVLRIFYPNNTSTNQNYTGERINQGATLTAYISFAEVNS